jgi:hypothetical protein
VRPGKASSKTRLIAYGAHAIANRTPRGEGKPETFDVLDFTHICERHRKTGDFIVRRKTAHTRLVAKLKRCSSCCASVGTGPLQRRASG